MAASLIRTCTEFSSLKQPFYDIVKSKNVRKYISQGLFLTCVQCQCYHTTPRYFKKHKKNVVNIEKKILPVVDIWNEMTVQELSNSTKRDINDVIEAIYLSDSFNHYKQDTAIVDKNVLQNTVRKLGVKFKIITRPDDKEDMDTKDHDVTKRPPPDKSVLVKRHPVVTIMGHIDHGKTTLLDTLRDTSVVDTEFGGITQHIGAFNVTLKTGERITFLDTPGHAAFNVMRMRGAQVTDIVVLVVAADDGVMEQTVESINMAKSANVPIIVAINKIDKPNANIARTENMLSQLGIHVEALGGDVQSVHISALHGTNVNTLTEAIALQAELIGLKGDPTGLVEAVVIECSTELYRGKLSTILIQRGTLRKGACLVGGRTWAKVRSIFDHSGNPVTEAKLSEAVQIMGWKDLPSAGEVILEVKNEKKARMVTRYREMEQAKLLAQEHQIVAEKKHEKYLIEYKKHLEFRRTNKKYFKIPLPIAKDETNNELPKLNVIIKGDVAGSVEAILDVLNTYGSDDKCQLNVVHYDVGPVIETDLHIAETFGAVIYHFNVGIMKNLQEEAEKKQLSVRAYNVIYKLVDDIKKEINNRLPLVDVEKVIGEANVLQEFEITEKKKKRKVAGCRCVKGNLKKTAMYRLMRAEETIYTGKLTSMRHMKNETDTIKTNIECGLKLDDDTISYKPGDVLICYQIIQEPQETDWDPGF